MSKDKEATGTRRFRKLEELNLIDNFLFQEMLAQKEEGEEFARILLSTILEKNIRKVRIIPQKHIQGIDTDQHGISIVIIVILPYDPLGKDRMVYTIKNSCAEDLSVPYDDGPERFFCIRREKKETLVRSSQICKIHRKDNE